MSRLEQAVLVGSPFEALRKNFIQIPELLQWLVATNASVKDGHWRHLVAYKAASTFGNLRNQTVTVEGKSTFFHLVTSNDYRALYWLLTGSPDDNEESVKQYCASMEYTLLNKDVAKVLRLIGGQAIDITPETVALALQARHPTPALRGPPRGSDITPWVEADWFDQLPKASQVVPPEKFFEAVLARSERLAKDAPDYWKEVAAPEYIKLLKKQVNASTSAELLKRLQALDASLVPVEWLNLSPLAWQLRQFPPLMQGYLLGLPIHLVHPTETVLSSALVELSRVGPEKYVEALANHYRATELPALPPGCGKIQLCNDKDLVLMEDIYLFSPFDRVYTIDGLHAHCFVRSEFDNILKNRQNPYTKGKLKSTVLAEIKRRHQNTIPPCEPLLSLLQQVGEKKLAPPPKPTESKENPFAGLLAAMRDGSMISMGTLPETESETSELAHSLALMTMMMGAMGGPSSQH